MKNRLPRHLLKVGCIYIGVLLAIPNASSQESVQPVSMVNLIASPREYLGRKVSVTGYLSPIFSSLSLTKDLAEDIHQMSSVHVTDTSSGDITYSNCPGQFVRIQATFETIDTPHSYALAEVEVIYDMTGKVCYTKSKKVSLESTRDINSERSEQQVIR